MAAKYRTIKKSTLENQLTECSSQFVCFADEPFPAGDNGLEYAGNLLLADNETDFVVFTPDIPDLNLQSIPEGNWSGSALLLYQTNPEYNPLLCCASIFRKSFLIRNILEGPAFHFHGHALMLKALGYAQKVAVVQPNEGKRCIYRYDTDMDARPSSFIKMARMASAYVKQQGDLKNSALVAWFQKLIKLVRLPEFLAINQRNWSDFLKNLSGLSELQKACKLTYPKGIDTLQSLNGKAISRIRPAQESGISQNQLDDLVAKYLFGGSAE